MFEQFSQFVPSEGIKIVLVLFLSFLIGLEREEHKAGGEHYSFGGVRTFPLIGLIGYAVALLSGNQILPEAIGFAVVGAFLLMSYWHKLSSQPATTTEVPGVTSEISGLGTYLVGALVYHGYFWVATTVTVASILLLELKTALEGLTKRLPPQEILTFTKFLAGTAVILPILPNQAFTRFQINPFKTWLVVVAVSTISYGSYVLLKVARGKSGVLLSAVLGGAYSSTATTVALAKRAAHEQRPHLFAGGILIASGVMYLRLALLVAIFNRELARLLWPPFLVLAATALLAGLAWSHRPDPSSEDVKREFQPGNPLELRAAFTFAALFLGVLVVTRYVVEHLGRGGVFGLAAIMGVADVDPFLLGMVQSAGGSTPLMLAAAGICIAAASNNLAKGIYAWFFADRRTGVPSLGLLATLALLGLAPLLWL